MTEFKNVFVQKKDGTLEKFNVEKIKSAINKSAYRALSPFVDNEMNDIIDIVTDNISKKSEPNKDGEIVIPVSTMHIYVELALDKIKPEVAKSYRDYRNYKHEFVEMMDDVYVKSQTIMYRGDKENSNSDSALVSTKRSLVFNQLNKSLYQKFFMTTEELQACRDGYIYIHDMSARRDTMNCCLFDMKTVLDGGFDMGNMYYNEPKSLDTAFDVIGDVVLATASQQYGGFTVPEIDKILEPYAEKSYHKYREEYMNITNDYYDGQNVYNSRYIDEKAHEYAMQKVERDFEQGFQGLEYKFNTVASSRGDYPFTTLTAGLATGVFGKMATKMMLKVRAEGQGKDGFKKPVLFPKLVFLYDENLHGKGKELEDVFEAGIECSSKTMYPDWLSLTGGNGYLQQMYKKYGKVISPMGCVDGKEIVTYRFNGKLYVEAFERMWDRLTDRFTIKRQFEGSNKYLYMDLENVEIYDTIEGFVNTSRIIRNYTENWIDLRLSNGRKLRCTPDHPLTLLDGTTKHVEDLVKGDQIKIGIKQVCDVGKEKFNTDKAWLLGFFLCDGCYSDNSVFASIASSGEDEIEKKFDDVMYKYFGLHATSILQERGERGTYKDLRVYSDGSSRLSEIINYFTVKYGGINKKHRQVPSEVFSWDIDSMYAFMAGMIDADGYINATSHGGSVVQIGSTNKELALQQMALAQALGMPAKLYINLYNKARPTLVQYRVEFVPDDTLVSYIECEKKRNNFVKRASELSTSDVAEVLSIEPVEFDGYSYDVTTDSEHFEVSGIYSHNCRAFLSPYYERGGFEPADDEDQPVFVGRFNCGAISLHLPMILAKSRQENKDFYEVLDYYLDMIQNVHIRTREYLGHMKASTNPVAYCEGGFYGGHLQPNDKIAPILKYATFSFGITALNELQRLYNGKDLTEDNEFCLEVMRHINEKINYYKKRDNMLTAIYGTPAESLCSLQVKQFRKKYGIIEGVSDREYVSNSFHCHVTSDITPVEKQDLEEPFWDLFRGGRIQYCRYPINYNIEAIRVLVRRAMEKGYYEGVNLSLAYCENCGYEELEMDVCPKCGSKDLTKIDRMNGYLSFSRVKGDTRLNAGKMAEIAERKSM